MLSRESLIVVLLSLGMTILALTQISHLNTAVESLQQSIQNTDASANQASNLLVKINADQNSRTAALQKDLAQLKTDQASLQSGSAPAALQKDLAQLKTDMASLQSRMSAAESRGSKLPLPSVQGAKKTALPAAGGGPLVPFSKVSPSTMKSTITIHGVRIVFVVGNLQHAFLIIEHIRREINGYAIVKDAILQAKQANPHETPLVVC
jgi:hypothetical protein